MKLFIWIFACFVILGVCGARRPNKTRYDNFKLYGVTIQEQSDLKNLRNAGINVITINECSRIGSECAMAINPSEQKRFEKLLKSYELEYRIISNNLQNTLDKETIGSRKNKCKNKKNCESPLTWTEYHELDDINAWQKYWQQNTNFVKRLNVGRSYEKRKIEAIKISKNKNNKAILVESNIHAIEWISSAAGTCFFDNLLRAENTEMKNLLENYDWIFVPVLNPDGFVYSHNVERLWRKNRKPTGFSNSSGICYGTDLNRNFDFHWGGAGYNIDVPCDHWYGGSAAATEPEVQAMQKFVGNFKNDYIRMYLALHSYGQFVLLPYGHTTTEFPPNYNQMMNISNAFTTAANAVSGNTWDHGASGLLNYPVSGASKDWAYGVKKIPYTATIELPDRGTYGFFLPASRILAVCEELTQGLIAMVKKAKDEGIFN